MQLSGLSEAKRRIFSIARAFLFVSATIVLINSASAQHPANTSAIGLPKFATVTNGPDVTNVGNLNVDGVFGFGQSLPPQTADGQTGILIVLVFGGCVAVAWVLSSLILGCVPALRRAARLICLGSLCIAGSITANAQDANGSNIIGLPQFGTLTNGPDNINLGNLNIHWEFPVISKPGRGFPFTLAITYDSLGSGLHGWSVVSSLPNGSANSVKVSTACGGTGFNIKYTDTYTSWSYKDSSNVLHWFPNASISLNNCTHVTTSSGAVSAPDGSGSLLTPRISGAEVRTAAGVDLMLSGSMTGGAVRVMTDTNGNSLTTQLPNWQAGLAVTWADTAGIAVVTATPGFVRSTKPPPQPPFSPDTYTYTDSNGKQETVTVNWGAYTVQNSFPSISNGACASTLNSAVPNVPLVNSIVYPDNSTYSFTYEPTPGVAGNVTGRLQSVTLPTGAPITYTYTGANEGVNCDPKDPADTSTLGLTRQDSDGTTSYNRTQLSSTEWKTVVTYPPDSVTREQNQSDFYFQNVLPISGGGAWPTNDLYETKRLIFQGSDQGTPIQTIHTCYNGNAPDCTATQVTFPITQITKLAQLSNGLQNEQVTFMNSAGLVTEKDEYDYGKSAPGPLLRKTLTQYEVLGNNILDRPSSVTAQDGSGNQIAQTTYTYDTRGNATTVSRWLNSNGTWVRTNNTYDADNGNLLTATDANQNVTTYNYTDSYSDGVNRNSLAYVTKITMPDTKSPNLAHHVTSAKYDANTGLKIATFDQNGNETDYSYDLMLRPVSVTLPADVGGNRPRTTLSYPDPNTITQQKTITTTLTDTVTAKLDGMRRAAHIQHGTPNGTAISDASYDSIGRLSQVSNPYFSATDATYGVTQTQHDGLGRTIKTTKQDGSTTTAQYDQTAAASTNGNCVLLTDEASNQRKTCQDGLGRLIEVDEPGGESPAVAATGSLTINGTLQSWSATQTATSGHIELTFSGALQSKASCSPSGQPCSDSGSITITVNTPSGAFTKSAAYSSATGADSSQTVRALASAFHSDSTSPVDAIYYGADESGNVVMDLVARATGSATNYPVTIPIVSNDPTDFSPPSFQVSAGSSLIDGRDASTASTSGHAYVSFSGSLQSKASCSATSGQPCTDSGSISTTVTTASGALTKSVAYRSATGGDSGQAVQMLANAFHSDSASPVDAFFTTDESGNYVLYLTARTTGSGTDYPLSTSIVSNDPTDFASPSFQVSEGSSLVGGQNGTAGSTVYDSGTVYVSVGPFVASAAYSQSGNNTAALVASALVSGSTGLNQSSSPVTAVVSGSTITLTYKTPGSAGNLPVDFSSSTANPDNPSFTNPGIILSGGSDAQNGTIATPNVTLYHYDALNNLQCVHQKGADGSADRSCNDATVPSAWRPRNFAYDSLSRLLTATNPESGTISYSYDADGNLLQKTSPAPNQTGSATQTISYCYDALNRVTGKAYSAQNCPLNSPVVTYAYDGGTNGIGHLTSLTDQAGSGAYTVDALGRMITEQRTIAGKTKTLAYTYNLDNSIAKFTYPSSAVVTYTPDSAGRMVSAVDSANNISYVTSASYGPDNSLTGFVSGHSSSLAGITNSFSYNQRLQPVTMSASSPTATLFSIGYDFHLGNGDNGDVFAITNNRDASRNQTFTYDALNRLTSAQNAGTDCSQSTVNGKTKFWGNSYGYDAWGNLLQKAVTKCSAENLSVAALADNQLVGYGYDAGGNMIHDATTGNNYSFDPENRIIGAAGYTYTYDADGSRVMKSNGSTGTIYWSMSPGIVAESDLTGNLTAEYVFFGGRRTARRDFSGSTPSVSYYFSDRLGTADVITDSAGNIKAESDYRPYGDELAFINNDTNKYKFDGQERDGETGLDNMGHRYYSNQLSRFMTPDIPGLDQYRINPQTWNLYTFGRNNPLRFTDPTGNYVCGSSVSAAQCSDFQKGLDKAQTAANKLKDQYGADSTKYTDAQRAIDAYGKADVDNGVTIQVGAAQNPGAGGDTSVANTTGAKTADNPTGQKITVTLNAAYIGNAGAEAHEGSHVADGSAWVASGFSAAMNPTRYATEFRAYSVQANILNTEYCFVCAANFIVGGTQYPFTSPAWSDSTVRGFINDYLALPKSQGGLYEVTPESKVKAFTQPKKPK